MRIRVGVWVVFALWLASPASAQDAADTLTLDEALDVARANNPTYLRASNDRELADWDVRQAWGQLLPSASASTSMSWQGAGEQQFGTLTLGDLGFGNLPSYYLSSYGVSVGLNLDWSTLRGPALAKAQRGATAAQIRVSEAVLVTQVTQAYLEVLRQREGLRLAEQQLENGRFNLRLAQGRLEVGTATPIDVGQAEVQVGRAEVAVLQAENAVATAQMRLLQQLGVPVDRSIELGSTFELAEPTWTEEELLTQAVAMNPDLEVSRKTRDAASVGVSQAKGAYYPSLSLSTGWNGFTREASSVDVQVAQARAQVASQVDQCSRTNEVYARLADPLPLQDCTRFAFTDANRQSIVDANNQFPFSFQQQPFSVGLRLSVPIFQGLSRQRNLEAARLQQEDATQQMREQELSLRAELRISLANVRTAYQSALLEQRNLQLAEQQLRLARERYQVGAITFVELVDAQTVLALADRDRTAAIFAYHDAVSTLEALVGAPLRN
jgi:outer membrane protein